MFGKHPAHFAPTPVTQVIYLRLSFCGKFLFSLNGPTGPIQSLTCNVCVCVWDSVCHFCAFFFKRLITPIYKCCNSIRSISKRFLREYLRKDIGLRINNGQNFWPEKSFLFVLCHSLSMDLGHNQQQHPTVQCA